MKDTQQTTTTAANFNADAISEKLTNTKKRVRRSDNKGFERGHIVEHGVFGKGVIITVSGKFVDVKFASIGSKRLVDTFLEPIEA